MFSSYHVPISFLLCSLQIIAGQTIFAVDKYSTFNEYRKTCHICNGGLFCHSQLPKEVVFQETGSWLGQRVKGWCPKALEEAVWRNELQTVHSYRRLWALDALVILQALAQPQSSPPQRTIHVVSCQCGISEMLMKFWQTADKRERGDPTDKAITFNKTSFLVCHFLPAFFMNTQTEWIDVMHTRNDKCLKEWKKTGGRWREKKTLHHWRFHKGRMKREAKRFSHSVKTSSN